MQLFNLTAGAHTVRLYAEDSAGNDGSDMMEFNVEKPTALGDSSLVIILSVWVATVIAGIGAFAYHRKHRRR
jgi:hypothetical protein